MERAGTRCRDLGRGDFVGLIGADGSPLPPAGVTVRLETSARVLVIDPVRLATLIGAHPEYAAEWQGLSSRLGRPGTADGAGGGPAPPWRLSGTGPPPAPSTQPDLAAACDLVVTGHCSSRPCLAGRRPGS